MYVFTAIAFLLGLSIPAYLTVTIGIAGISTHAAVWGILMILSLIALSATKNMRGDRGTILSFLMLTCVVSTISLVILSALPLLTHT